MRLEGRMIAFKVLKEESPGSTERGCWITSSEGNLRESATENIPPAMLVRVKWCGKSAPRLW